MPPAESTGTAWVYSGARSSLLIKDRHRPIACFGFRAACRQPAVPHPFINPRQLAKTRGQRPSCGEALSGTRGWSGSCRSEADLASRSRAIRARSASRIASAYFRSANASPACAKRSDGSASVCQRYAAGRWCAGVGRDAARSTARSRGIELPDRPGENRRRDQPDQDRSRPTSRL